MGRSGLIDITERVNVNTVFPDTEMDVAARGISGRACLCDLLTLFDFISDRYKQLGVVTVQGRDAAAVIDDNVIAIAVVIFGNDDDTGICRKDR